jgi:N-acetyl-gamma-glutamyl-phosphate reductase
MQSVEKNKKMKASIIGAAGFVGGELIRLLQNHPKIANLSLQSNSQAGKHISEIHSDLYDTELHFQTDFDKESEVIFICRGHGQTAPFLEKNKISAETVIIDMSSDFRIENEQHDFVYALPEWQRDRTKTANRIANCGCFATAMQLAILPLLKAGLLKKSMHINGITGSTGAGFAKSDTTHFSWRNSNISLYKAFNHQHLNEVKQLINAFSPDYEADVNFIPMRGNFTRGILVSIYTETEATFEEIKAIYTAAYITEPFTQVTEKSIHLKQVVNTNNCLLQIEKHDNKVLITSAIDNLLKGAAGQAVQNMNIRFGFEERTGLNLKPSAF